MFSKKRIILGIGLSVILVSGYFLIPQFVNYFKWKNSVEAAGSFPYQIGLTNVTMIQCTVSCNGGCCIGGTLCEIKDPAACAAYQEVNGTIAGGMGNNALFSTQAIAQSGLTNGGQLIAGGMSTVLMDNGVLASVGGCYGCYAKAKSIEDKIANWFDFIIAGFRKD
ncbi:hypothetical protein KAU19_06680 [Candidatus Parcubacteria bacterium]|nr:hypothetical protein [Candidatus Parcubacteria bacterium]